MPRRRTIPNFPYSIKTSTNAADEVDFGNDSSLVLDGDFTIAVWLKSNDVTKNSGTYGIFGKRTDASNREFNCYYVQSSDQFTFKVANTGGTAANIFQTTGVMQDNKWMRIAITRSGNTFSLYKDGKLVETATDSTVIGDTSASVTLGAWADDGGTNWDGYLTRFHINNGYAWSAFEVSEDFYEVQQAGQSTVVLDAHVVTGSGSTVLDVSGNGNNGTIEGSASWSTDTPGVARSDISQARSDISQARSNV